MNYSKKFVRGFVIVFLGLLLANLFAYLLRILLARSLGIEEYGLIYAVISLFSLVSVFQTLGLGESLTMFIATANISGKKILIQKYLWTVGLTLYTSSAIIAVVAIFFARILGKIYFKTENSSLLIILFSIVMFFSVLDILFLGLCQGLQKSIFYSGYYSLKIILILLFTSLFLMFGLGSKGAILAYLAAYLILYPFAFLVIRTLIKSSGTYDFSKRELKRLLRYGIPVMLSIVAGTILTYTDTLMLVLFQSSREVGIYQAALPTANILLFISSALSIVLLPFIAKLWEKKESKLISQTISKVYSYVILLFLPLCFSFIIFPDIIIKILFGIEYMPAANILRVLAITAVFSILNTVHIAVLSGIGMPKETTKAVYLGAVANIFLNILLIPKLGGLGAAITTLISMIIIYLISFRAVQSRIPFHISFAKVLRIFISGSFFLMTLLFLRGFLHLNSQISQIILSVFISGCVYLILIFILKVISIQEIRSLFKKSI